ncbi:hypothetical protein [Candidatus Nitrospira nitrificans]|uniref:Uncharacterized protein n=1 Tax=Candidatus Nitrospira nitrificans TaxID=1742973 RepID=A0A0S4LPY5_9BACT|nr:hypothetical protein [Candidatus Nitrospira nitrificans]CUS39564.1 hypothetical protein COMA2_80056 [Candidatus Nitrospira nitrificans]
MRSSFAAVPTYSESLRIGWTLLWRGTGSVLLLLILCNILLVTALPELQRTGPSLWATVFSLAVVTCVAAFGIMPFVVRTLFTATYTRFHLQLVRNVEPTIQEEIASRDTSSSQPTSLTHIQ